MAAVLLVVFESDFLYTAQEQNLFLHTPLFFTQQMVRAGGLLTWAGCYLTQFFYYPMLGAGLLCLLWAFLMWLLQRTFRWAVPWLTLVPVACLLMTVVTLGYWVFYLKLPGALFVPTLGAIVATSMAWLGQRSMFNVQRSLFIVLAACVGYPLFGFYGLWGTVLMGCFGKKRHLFAAIAAVIAVPLVCYYTIYHETNIVNIYWAALPVYAMHGEHYFAYSLPYIVLVVGLSPIPSLFREGGKWSLFSPPSTGRGRGWVWWARGSVVLVFLFLIFLFWYKDANFHRELSMQRSIERQDWEAVLSEARGLKGEPTRALCLMRNLALFRLGQSGEKTRQYVNGSAHPDAPFPVRLVHTYGKMLYLQYGIPNYCYRWCMEDGVEYGWTVERLKLMTKCSLLNGEMVAAQRFINALKKTDFHRKWALKYEEYIHRPKLIGQDPELKPILPLLRTDNFLTSDQSQEEWFLIEHFLSSPGETPEQKALSAFTMQYYHANRQQIIEP